MRVTTYVLCENMRNNKIIVQISTKPSGPLNMFTVCSSCMSLFIFLKLDLYIFIKPLKVSKNDECLHHGPYFFNFSQQSHLMNEIHYR